MGIIKAFKLGFDYLKYDEDGNVQDTQRAVNDVNLDIEAGQFVAVLGHNGSGKSTLAKHLNALLLPTEGTLWVDGIDTSKEPELWKVRQKAGMVFQNPDNQIIGTVVEEDVGFGPENMGVPTEKIWERVDESLKKTGMTSYRYHSPNKLSGGQKQRVAIAGVLAMRPKCIILDEPTAGLDPKGRDDILDQIAELHKVRGITIILVSHSMEDIAKYAERLIVVNDGEIAYDDAPKAVFAHYRELEAMGLAAPQITYIMHALKEKGLDVDVTATTVDEAKENILAVLRKCNPGKLSGDKQSVSDSQSKKENAKAETLISEMEADLTEDGTKESHSDAPDEDLSIQKETMDKKSAEQEENEGGQEV